MDIRLRWSTVPALACLLLLPLGAAAQVHVSGEIGPGSLYEIDVPAAWNGDLVLYAHGIVQAEQPVAAPTIQDGYNYLRAALLSAGFAVAASSYSSNGWSLDDAVRRTHQLSGIFKARVGSPARTYLAGHSMGALAIVKMLETFPGQYDGALPMCGPLGGALHELQYAGDARVTLDYFFPGLLPGDPFHVPAGTQYLSPTDPGGPSLLFLQVYSALLSNPLTVMKWATVAKLPFASSTELFSSALYVVGFGLRYTNDLVERVHDKIPYDNRLSTYTVLAGPTPAADTALLNLGVARYDADRAALNYYERNYAPSGQLEVPVLTLHTTRDPAIPRDHEDLFAATVAAAGRSDFLVRREVNAWGHCAFAPADVQAAFSDLVQWVTTGVRP